MDLIMYLILVLLSLDQVLNSPHGRRKKLQPTFLPTPTDITVHRGELAVLKCHIKDVGPKKVVWREQSSDVPLTIGETIFSPESNMAIEVDKISEHETQYDLIIKDVELKHSGTYLCQVTASKTYAHYVTLTVLDEPVKAEKSIKLTGTEFVNQGSRIMLMCNVTGILQAPVDVDWFFKGERIIISLAHWRDRTQILRRTKGKMYISELIVERSTPDDNGIYVCRSSGSSIDVESIVVNVLSVSDAGPISFIADKPNVSRRDKEQFPQSDSSGYRNSATVVTSHSNMIHILTLTICIIIALTSNSCTHFPIKLFSTYEIPFWRYDNYAHR